MQGRDRIRAEIADLMDVLDGPGAGVAGTERNAVIDDELVEAVGLIVGDPEMFAVESEAAGVLTGGRQRDDDVPLIEGQHIDFILEVIHRPEVAAIEGHAARRAGGRREGDDGGAIGGIDLMQLTPPLIG